MFAFCTTQFPQTFGSDIAMLGLSAIEQWAVRLYVRALTINVAQDHELQRLKAETLMLRAVIDGLRRERLNYLADSEEVT